MSLVWEAIDSFSIYIYAKFVLRHDVGIFV
jgi:hypothetical protein